jgi:hypothetical protein
MNKVQFITTPGGEEMAVLPRADYERLLEEAEMMEDIAALEEAQRALAAGEDELIPAEFAHRILDGESTIRVWREFRGLSPELLASRAGVGADRLADLEALSRPSESEEVQAIAAALGLDVDDLVMNRG